VVDDDLSVLGSLKRLLEFDGHEVHVAHGGSEALVLFAASTFDLVISDYEMPGMKGDKLAAAIKTLAPEQPVLLITAYGEALRSAHTPLTCVDLVLAKPFRFSELRLAVASLLRPGCPPVQPGPPKFQE
jgi:CheY-like chemotaxis protein